MTPRRAATTVVAAIVMGAVLAGSSVDAAVTTPAAAGQATVCAGRGAVRLVAAAAPCPRGESRASVGWVARGAWTASTSYAAGAVVLRPAGAFVARLPSTGRAPESNPTSWSRIAQRDSSATAPSGPPGADGAPGPVGAAGPPGAPGAQGSDGLPAVWSASATDEALTLDAYASLASVTVPAGSYVVSAAIDLYPTNILTSHVDCLLFRATAPTNSWGETLLTLPANSQGFDQPISIHGVGSGAGATTVEVYCFTDGPVTARSVMLQAIPVTAVH